VLKEVHYWDTVRRPHGTFRRRKARQDLEWYCSASLRARMARYHRVALFEAAALRRLLEARIEAFEDRGGAHAGYAALLLDGSRPGQVLVDNTPAYALLRRTTFAEMDALAGEARFLFIMRDPVARLWSGLRHRFGKQLGTGGMTAAELEARFLAVLDADLRGDLARSDYRRTITELEAAVPPARILYLFHETQFAQGPYDRLADFLGVARRRGRVRRRVNRGVEVGSPGPGAIAAARERLAEVYAFVRERFGAEVPAEWMR
jgi:hypothetical protein